MSWTKSTVGNKEIECIEYWNIFIDFSIPMKIAAFRLDLIVVYNLFKWGRRLAQGNKTQIGLKNLKYQSSHLFITSLIKRSANYFPLTAAKPFLRHFSPKETNFHLCGSKVLEMKLTKKLIHAKLMTENKNYKNFKVI